ncbi:unnamed protein product, partial [Polarella glacialis]
MAASPWTPPALRRFPAPPKRAQNQAPGAAKSASREKGAAKRHQNILNSARAQNQVPGAAKSASREKGAAKGHQNILNSARAQNQAPGAAKSAS